LTKSAKHAFGARANAAYTGEATALNDALRGGFCRLAAKAH
jgi:hypothetical protein